MTVEDTRSSAPSSVRASSCPSGSTSPGPRPRRAIPYVTTPPLLWHLACGVVLGVTFPFVEDV